MSGGGGKPFKVPGLREDRSLPTPPMSMGLRITKHILLFDLESEIKLPEMQIFDRLFARKI
jgi:hypothetical protein